jgi:hypothetical protein
MFASTEHKALPEVHEALAHAAPIAPVRRTAASSAGVVTTIATVVTVAQNAEVPGDSSSINSHQSSSTIGTR